MEGVVLSEGDFLEAWGEDNIKHFPRDEWIREHPAQSDLYPDVDFLPIEMSAVYTSDLDGCRFALYDRINIELGEGEVLSLLVIGAVPADPDTMLFGFDVNGGRIVLLGVDAGTLELVNSSFRALTEFLYHFARFVDSDTGKAGRPERATELRIRLEHLDPAAFASADSWWSVATSSMGAIAH